MNPNSLYAYAVLSASGARLTVRQKVARYIHDNPGCTLHDICKGLEKYPHQISGRITELKDCNAVVTVGRRLVGGFPCDQYQISGSVAA